MWEWNSWIAWLFSVSLTEEPPQCFTERPHHRVFALITYDASDFSTSSLILVILLFLNDGPPRGCEVLSHCDLDLHFPND